MPREAEADNECLAPHDDDFATDCRDKDGRVTSFWEALGKQATGTVCKPASSVACPDLLIAVRRCTESLGYGRVLVPAVLCGCAV